VTLSYIVLSVMTFMHETVYFALCNVYNNNLCHNSVKYRLF